MDERFGPLVRTERYIALFDVLGFGELVENNRLDWVAETFSGLIHKLKTFSGGLSLWDYSPPNYRVFSDTVLVYSDDCSIRQFESTIKFCQLFMPYSFHRAYLLEEPLQRVSRLFRATFILGSPSSTHLRWKNSKNGRDVGLRINAINPLNLIPQTS